jgi:hypothetical protein
VSDHPVTSRYVRVTLDVDVLVTGRADLGVSDESLRAAIDLVLGDYSDGRQPFAVELVRRGLDSIIPGAFENAVSSILFHRYGNRYIGQHLISYYLRLKKLAGFRTDLYGYVRCTKVAPVEMDPDDPFPPERTLP